MTDNNKPYIEEENIIDLTPSQHVDTSDQEATEKPVIIIESDDRHSYDKPVSQPRGHKRLIVTAIISTILLIISLAVIGGWLYYRLNQDVELPISCTPKENIEKLQAHRTKEKAQVIYSKDSVGNVELNIYELHGLKAEISFSEPDSTDTKVYLYSRCADFIDKGRILGSMTVKGKRYSDDNSRKGYCAMLHDNVVIGVSEDEAVRDYVEEKGGSFFRQFVLVSDGDIPRVFHLHKKVERCALARMSYTNQLYYITSTNPETMYDFADAIRRYGFVDAIYVTGGNSHSYYRTADKKYHNIGQPKSKKPKKIPWLVFKKM